MRTIRLALLLGALAACEPETFTGWAFANRRDHALEVWVRRTDLCADQGDLSDENNYQPAQRAEVKAQDFVRLRDLETWAAVGSGCGAVWLRVAGEFNVVLAWDDEPVWDLGADPTPYSVIVEGPRHHLVLHLPDEIEELPPPGL